jgi:mannose-6-phosphate isomerase-like protein (cupin superfamily)
MKHIKTGKSRGSFDVLFATRSAQAAMMTLRPGGASDDQPSNEHPECEQWLFVLAGKGEAVIGKGRSARRVPITENSLVVIEKGELHQIKNLGRKLLRTLNVYVPPAYTSAGAPTRGKQTTMR